MGPLYIRVSEFKGRPFELFATVGKSGKSTQAKTEAIGRLISLAFRSGIEVDEIIEQISGIRGEHAVFQDGGLVYSIPDAIAKVLQRRYLPKGNGKKSYQKSLKHDRARSHFPGHAAGTGLCVFAICLKQFQRPAL